MTFAPPIEPMLAKLTRTLPEGDYLYEPKWDGFRCLAFVADDGVDLRSRNQRPLARYFPEVVGDLARLGAGCVLDGELIVARDGTPDFSALLARLHPAKSRAEHLAATAPGMRVYDAGAPGVASLLLGVFDDASALRHVGVASSFRRPEREQLFADLVPLAIALTEHPWREGFALEGGPTGRLRGAAGRWTPDMTMDWIALALVLVLVCEVAYDQRDGYRFRHPARFLRWRPDRDAASCTVAQFDP